jgi:PadR family transcriptional regulator, regulatory protein PadR
MPDGPRLSHQGLKVLRVFLVSFHEDVRAELAGADIMKAARIQSGTLYPILLRLERVGVLTSRWEDDRPQELGRPRRRLYRLTSSGVEFASNALSELFTLGALPTPGEA